MGQSMNRLISRIRNTLAQVDEYFGVSYTTVSWKVKQAEKRESVKFKAGFSMTPAFSAQRVAHFFAQPAKILSRFVELSK